MSAVNGDKSRYQRLRQAGLRRREKSRLAMAAMRLVGTRGAAGPEETASDVGPAPKRALRLVVTDQAARVPAPGGETADKAEEIV